MEADLYLLKSGEIAYRCANHAPSRDTVDEKWPAPEGEEWVCDVCSPAVTVQSAPTTSIPFDDYQKAVILWPGKSVPKTNRVTVAAGAGSGKSTCLVARAVTLVKSKKVDPAKIVILVYNRAAGDDLRAKIAKRLDQKSAAAMAATFHGFGLRILGTWKPTDPRFHKGHILGLPDCTVKAASLAKGIVKQLGIRAKVEDVIAMSGYIREAGGWLEPQFHKSTLDIIATFPSLDSPDGDSDAEGDSAKTVDQKIADLYSFCVAYEAAKKAKHLSDFPTMLYEVCSEIRDQTPRARQLQNVYQHVMVDECQDINVLREMIANWIGKNADTYMQVGDLRQSIYSFTGARPDLFTGPVDSGAASLLIMPVNRRCAQRIVAVSNTISEGADWNLGGACQAAPGVPKGEIQIRIGDEARTVCDEIEAQINSGKQLADEDGKMRFGILSHTKKALGPILTELHTRGIAYRNLVGADDVWGQDPGASIVGYLECAAGNYKSLRRIMNKPSRFVSNKMIAEWGGTKSDNDIPGVDTLKNAMKSGLRQGRELAVAIDSIAQLEYEDQLQIIEDFLVADVKGRAQQESRLTGEEIDTEGDEEAVSSMISEARDLGSLGAIHNAMKEAQEREKEDAQRIKQGLPPLPAVELISCHKAKGLEWVTVFLIDCTDAQFPHPRNPDTEEERRLFYVACTRAKRQLFISYTPAETRKKRIGPSKYLAYVEPHVGSDK